MALTDRDEAPLEREKAYEPPRAEDIETAHTQAEVAAGINTGSGGGPKGIEESDKWH